MCAAQPVNTRAAVGQRDEREAETVSCVSLFLRISPILQIILTICHILVL